ncbi:MAG: hypothetical protein LUD72_11280 [Bacteroidales bacterium]|nr:hypothetical protein [Bacteroidales bacterium]
MGKLPYIPDKRLCARVPIHGWGTEKRGDMMCVLANISRQVVEAGKQLGIDMTAGEQVGAELGVLRAANNNWRKMHGLPLYHRNRPSMWMARKSRLKRWKTENEVK